MSSEELSQSLKSTQLEQAYERALHEAERIYDGERARVLRVQLLLLQDDNDFLQDRIAQNTGQLDSLEDGNVELRHQLQETETELLHAQGELKVRLRDVERYKAESQALSASSSDATKMLTEKLALTRELATLKPELEHLKSQTSTQSNVLAEKLSLQREVSTLQVELETEKRAVQRLKSHGKQTEEDGGSSAEIEDLRKELAKERREAQKTDRDNKKKDVEWENQKEVLEGKLEAFRNKLRSTKEQLKEAQDELEKIQSAQFAKSAELTAARAAGANPRKRNVAHFDPDMTIGTPGHGNGRPAKRTKFVGNAKFAGPEKPLFSITPFLNRTLSILPESPSQVEESISKHIDSIAAEAEKSKSEAAKAPEKTKEPQKATAGGSPKRAVKGPPSQPLKETTNSKANGAVPKPRLAKVAEEDEADISKDDPPDFESDEPVKRQRVLGQKKRMFDTESDVEPLKPQRKLGPGLRGGGLGDLSFMTSIGGKKGKSIAAFSPLKKDRQATVV